MKIKKIARSVLAVAGIALISAYAISYRSALPEQQTVAASQFTETDIVKGKQLYDLGDCTVCHTRPNGKKDAGGLAIESPFGTIYSTNITPDAEYGIGSWSFEAFKRAMREGVSRDGHYLYPAFPYTAFTHTSDEDLKALYAYLMTQPAVNETAPQTSLSFPFNIRQGVAAWNWLFLDEGELKPDTTQSEQWNRGRYLVEGLGHCSACHSPRNAFFAEKQGDDHLSGGIAEGWDAPALNGRSASPNQWTQNDLVALFRTGYSPRHSVVAGPMGPVIRHGLTQLQDEDLDAMAAYLASFQLNKTDRQPLLSVAQAEENAKRSLDNEGARLFTGACMACHAQISGSDMFGVKPSLQLNTQFYLDKPDNAIRVVLDGIQQPAHDALGTMPGFRHNLNNHQISQVLNYIRQNVAGQPAWPDLEASVNAIRQETEKQQ